MQEPSDVKMYFYVDESGDPSILGRKAKALREDEELEMAAEGKE
jgi:hypothetical protein